jgi:hypothetical protein
LFFPLSEIRNPYIKCANGRIRRGEHRRSPEKFRLLFRQTDAIISVVSASEIIKELPKLSEAERRAIREGLLAIANQHLDVALCNQTALDGALMLDRMENE